MTTAAASIAWSARPGSVILNARVLGARTIKSPPARINGLVPQIIDLPRMPASLYLILCLPFALAAVLVALPKGGSRALVAWVAGLAPLAGLGVMGAVTPAIMAGDVLREGHAWIAEIGLDFALRMDGLAWVFCLLILGIGALVVLYAHHYLSAKDSPRRFFCYLLLFMGAMLGIVLAGNLLLLVVFWELNHLVPADRVLVAAPGCAPGRADGAYDHRAWRVGAAWRGAGDRAHGRQL